LGVREDPEPAPPPHTLTATAHTTDAPARTFLLLVRFTHAEVDAFVTARTRRTEAA